MKISGYPSTPTSDSEDCDILLHFAKLAIEEILWLIVTGLRKSRRVAVASSSDDEEHLDISNLIKNWPYIKIPQTKLH